jgi:hypothetical protein
MNLCGIRAYPSANLKDFSTKSSSSPQNRSSIGIEVEGILVTFVTCNYRNEYQKLQLGSGFKPTR